MVHTLELRFSPLHYNVFDKMVNNPIYEFKSIKKGEKYRKFISNVYREDGITSVALQRIDVGVNFFTFADIRINADIVLNKDVPMIDENGMESFRDDLGKKTVPIYDLTPRIDKIYDIICKRYPELNPLYAELTDALSNGDYERYDFVLPHYLEYNKRFFILNEIDFAYDLPIHEFIQTYFSIMKHSKKMPKHIKQFSHIHDFGVDNTYAKSNSVKINIYDKYREILEENGDERVAEDNKYLRIEIAFKKNKLKYEVKTDERVDARTLSEFLYDPTVCQDAVITYLDKIVYSGTYYDINTAKKMIDKLNISDIMKKRYKDTLVNIRKHKGIKQYLDFLDSTGGAPKPSTVKKYLKDINDYGINPLTLSTREKNAFYDESSRSYWLPSLQYLVRMYSKHELDDPIDSLIELVDGNPHLYEEE